MSDREPKTDSRPTLGEILRAGDPVADESAHEQETLARLRRRILRQEPAAAPAPRLRFIVPLATVALLAVWVSLPDERSAVESPVAGEAPRAAPAPTGATADDRRQLHFETPSGTRIVWVLDPNLTL